MHRPTDDTENTDATKNTGATKDTEDTGTPAPGGVPATSGRPDVPAPRTPRRGGGSAAARTRIAQQQSWVDLQVQQAMARGDFDDLPGAGKPIADLGSQHDPEWWIKKLVQREQIAVLPAALQLRKDDAELDAHLDTLTTEAQVRSVVEDFNARVIRARYTPVDGPPLITMPRDVEECVAAWQERRARRRTAAATAAEQAEPAPGRRRWWRSRRRT